MLGHNLRFSRRRPRLLALLLVVTLSGCSTENQSDDDGSREGSSSGKLCRKELDKDADGTSDQVTTYAYSQDEAGNTVVEARSRTSSDSEDLLTEVFDSEGRLLSSDSDLGADGKVENRTLKTYNSTGLLLTEEVYQNSVVTPTSTTSNTYDKAGNLLSDSVQIDSEFDGLHTYNSVYSYDEEGRLQSHILSDAEGVTLSTVSYSYAEEGRLLSEVSSPPDGSITSTLSYSYDDAGNVETETYSDGEGEVIEIRTYGYDKSNRKISMLSFDAEGTLVEEESYDEWGNQLTWQVDFDGDGVAETSRLNSYDTSGNLLRAELNDNPERPMIHTHTYNKDGEPLSDETDIDGDGVVDSRTSYLYDCQ